QIRAVIAAFIVALSIQLVFGRQCDRASLVRRLAQVSIIALLCIGTIAALRPDFSTNLLTGNGRDKIFTASFEIFMQSPHTGMGGGEHFQKTYQRTWKDLNMPTDGNNLNFYKTIGHAHSDVLMLLTHHGWPALLLWAGFIIHCLIFIWKYGNQYERMLFLSIAAMHQIAGLSETYLDYSNTTYAVILCYGLALHNPIRKYQQIKSNQAKP
ncbi:MAG: hypothetical protein COB77_02250, partial [Gammaproteobacteria bacterium]